MQKSVSEENDMFPSLTLWHSMMEPGYGIRKNIPVVTPA